MVTTEFDAHLLERYESKPRWEVTLSDGRKVYQDDERQGDSSWKFLRKYLEVNPSLSIAKMFIGFRDNTYALPDNAEGYFFRNSVLSCWGAWEKHSFIVGILEDGLVKVKKYELPELSFLGDEVRTIEDSGESLIICQKEKTLS